MLIETICIVQCQISEEREGTSSEANGAKNDDWRKGRPVQEMGRSSWREAKEAPAHLQAVDGPP